MSFTASARQALGRAPWLLMIAPAVVFVSTLLGVLPNHFEIPYNDQWENIWWWRYAAENGGLPKGYLFSQHNEHRILLPRLIYMAELKWFAGTNVLTLWTAFAIQLAAGALFVTVARPARLRWLGVLALAVSLCLTWSAVQWENLFWGFQIAFLGVYAAGGWALYLFCLAVEDRARLRWGMLALAVLMLTAATFNMANGLFAGFAMVLVAVAARRDWRAILIVAAATAALLALYLYGYKSVYHPPAPRDGFIQNYLTYTLAFLGNVWGFGRPEWAAIAGGVGAAGTLGMAALVITGRARDAARMALFGIVLFVGMSAGVTTLSRLGYGIGQALSSRYLTPGCYFWAAQALFWALTVQGQRRLSLKLVASLPLILVIALMPKMQRFSFTPMNGLRENLLLGSSAVVGGLTDDKALARLYPEPERVRQFTPWLRGRGLSVFAGDPGFRVGSLIPAERIVAAGACGGAFDIAAPDPSGGATWQVLGWAWDLEQDGPLQRILVADPAGVVTGVAMTGVRRDDVATVLKKPKLHYSGWTGLITPMPGQPLQAYGVRQGGTLCDIGKLPPRP